MPDTILFIVYVSDTTAATRFYADLLEIEPTPETDGYVCFDLGGGAGLSLWSGRFDGPAQEVPRTSEVCLALPGGGAAVDRRFARWAAQGVRVVSEPRDEGFGRTFVVADADGNLIRVAPIDR